MKKKLLAVAVLGAFAGTASAQTNITVYGEIDLAIQHVTHSPTSMVNGDNSRLGFKGTEDLGNGLAANFRLEQRFDADNGKNEGNGTRPLFQGRSWVGLSSASFGAVRLGRDLTPLQAYSGDFDPWGALRARPGMSPTPINGSYVSDPLNPSNTAQNRFSNAAFYSSPNWSGFHFDGAVTTKEPLDAGTPITTPYSVAGGYANGPIGLYAAYERNALRTSVWQIGGSWDFGIAKLMGTYGRTQRDENVLPPGTVPAGLAGLDDHSFTIGGTAKFGPGKLLAGYGETKFSNDAAPKYKQFSIGYEYALSKRTFVYADYSNQKTVGSETINVWDVGLNHTF